MTLDFRSDTVTHPSPAMLAAMTAARVGDDVYGEDPSVNELEATAAGLFGKEAAVFCPSGTMTNQIAIRCHTQPGDEVICDRTAHIYVYEGGGIALNAGCQPRTLEGDRGRITAAQIRGAINPDDVHKPRTALVCLENTANIGGGSCYDFEEILRIRAVCNEAGIGLHLDGARLFNALVATGGRPADYGRVFDSLSICLSKGLGCPVGSLLLGSGEFIRRARRFRKVMGGGMRQAGFLAAAGSYALGHNIDRLADDHAHAAMIGAALAKKEFIESVLPVETNIVIGFLRPGVDPGDIKARFAGAGLLINTVGADRLRFVTHLDIGRDMAEDAVRRIGQLA